jgi:hypothetical protein
LALAILPAGKPGKKERVMKIVMKPFIDGAGKEDGINSIKFYPKERVDEIFNRMAAAQNTGEEAQELRIFYQRMRRMYAVGGYRGSGGGHRFS